MIKSELIERLAQESRLNMQDAKTVVDTIFDTIVQTLANGGRVELRNFGILSLKIAINATPLNAKI